MNIKSIFKIISVFYMFSVFLTPIAANENDVFIEEPDIVSETAIVYDSVSGKILYDKNSDRQMQPASITKVLTALIAMEHLNPEETITFSDEAINSFPYGTSRIGIKVGETITVDQAIHGLLLMSGNEVANGLAEASAGSIDGFVELMNEEAKLLGANNSSFVNPHGLTDPNHYVTALDMALITDAFIKDDYLLSVMNDSFYEIPETNMTDEIRYLYQQHKMVNSINDMRIYREDVIAGKVGYTSESGHTLVTVASNGERTLIIVTLKTNSTNLYSDTEKLIEFGYATPLPPDPIVNQTATTLVTKEESPTVDLIVDQTAETTTIASGGNNTSATLDTVDSSDDDEPSSSKLPLLIIFVITLVIILISAKLHSQYVKRCYHNKYLDK